MSKHHYLSLFVGLSLVFTVGFTGKFPQGPDSRLTPGSLCKNPSTYRYPEKIPYCERKVASELKAQIIARYDSELGYSVSKMDRQAFKIDHYIPLCMGGSNEASNLWPQHESVYQHTDQLEDFACQKMALGKLKQAEAIELVRRAKANLEEAAEITRYVRAL